MTHSKITSALEGLRPGAQWSLMGDSYAGITWLDTVQVMPTETEIAAYVPPAPIPLTPAEKLAAAGLSVADLKTLLA